MSTRADDYRMQATECRQHAERSTVGANKETWLLLSDEWQRLAESLNPAHRAADRSGAETADMSDFSKTA